MATIKSLLPRQHTNADVIIQPRRGGFTAILQGNKEKASEALYNLAVDKGWKLMRIANGAYKIWERSGENSEALSNAVAHYLQNDHELSVTIED